MEKILIIGWRATEQHFLKELSSGLSHKVAVHVVCGEESAASETIQQLTNRGIYGDFRAGKGGFTDLVRIEGSLF